MAGRAAGQANTTQVTPGRGLPVGRAPVVPRHEPAVTDRSTPTSKRLNQAYAVGRLGLFAIPLLAIVAALGAHTTAAFSTDPVAYAGFVAHRWSSPMSIAITTATGFFAIISLISLALLLLGTRARWLAVAGFVIGLAGAVMMIAEVGAVVIRAQGVASRVLDGHLDRVAVTAAAHGTQAAILVFGGAALLTLGWMLLGVAILLTHGLNKGDGALLIVGAPLIFLGGFVLHVLPTMGAFLIGAAGLGILLTAGRIAPGRAQQSRPGPVPASVPAMSAFARFTDDDLEAFYRGEEASIDYAEPAPYESVTSVQPATVEAAETPVVAATTAAATANSATGTAPPKPARARTDRGLGRLSRGISTAWQVRRAGTASAGAPSTSNGTPTGTANGNGSSGASVPPKKSFSLASWSPFRSGDDKPPAAAGKPTTAANGSSKNGSSKNGSSKSGPASGQSKHSAGKNGADKNLASDRSSNDSVKNDAAKNDGGKHGSANGRKKFSTSASVLSTPSGSKNSPSDKRDAATSDTGPDKSANQPNVAAPSKADKAANRGTSAGGKPGGPSGTGTPSENGASTARE